MMHHENEKILHLQETAGGTVRLYCGMTVLLGFCKIRLWQEKVYPQETMFPGDTMEKDPGYGNSDYINILFSGVRSR